MITVFKYIKHTCRRVSYLQEYKKEKRFTVCEVIHTMIDSIISIMVNRIVMRFQPVRIVLFGSQARGDATESSDIDLLVVMNDVKDTRQAAIAIRRLLKYMHVSKDIIVSTPDEIERLRGVVGTIAYITVREGKIVYEQQ